MISLHPKQLRLLNAYRAGEPLTDAEAHLRVGLLAKSFSYGQDTSVLRRIGFIERTGERARTPLGGTAALYIITSTGLEYLRAR